jgi:hypothetical protein
VIGRPPALAALPDRYGPLFDRAAAAFEADALTPSCERFDVIAERVGKLSATPLTRRLVVFDRDGLDELIPLPADPPPDPAVIMYLI